MNSFPEMVLAKTGSILSVSAAAIRKINRTKRKKILLLLKKYLI